MKKLLSLGILAAIALSSTYANATTRRVPQDYPTIQAAVDAAVAGDVVLVSAGTYGDVTHQAGNGDTTRCAVVMKSGITLQGSGAATTIIDANRLGRGIHCRKVTGSTIRDLTVRRTFAQLFGSAILVRDTSTVNVLNCTLTSCGDGGLIMLNGSGGTISGTTISNSLGKQGGGVKIENYCNPTIQFCTMTADSAPVGGAVDIRAFSNVTMSNCIINNNRIAGGIAGSGAGVNVGNSTATITNTQITNNSGDCEGGGVAVLDGANVTLTKSVIQGNSVHGTSNPLGAGLYVDSSTLYMEDCLIARNTANGVSGDGGGMYVASYQYPLCNVTAKQCTFATNAVPDAPSAGAGISFFIFGDTPSIQIQESIIAFNGPGSATECIGDPNPIAAGVRVGCSDIYSNTGGNSICGTDAGHNFSLDPLFCDMAHDNYRIAMNSPCFPGHHPDGPRACNGDLIGGQDPGCNPAGVDDGNATAAATRLIGNQPNPFHPATTIRYDLARAGRVDLRIFDVAGREVATLVSGMRAAGHQQAVWDGRTAEGALAPSGVYFYRLRIDGANETRRMVLTR